MSAVSSDHTLGRCPDCETEIPLGLVIIEYETDAGRESYAECPGCREVVHPI
ncbi:MULTISPECIES: DUF7837 family putative zinc-binding protein [Halomicrobium]|uniref:DUF7837 domain-containing protein n=1 Tax=Halomicrobium mukohataei (strain ATCC 700874 / DSM 12286 / JCM 9738 / NCIMB 13541) TaxID=485914 RepID=C7NY71_HALMD|nr:MULTISPECIES: hypothetical protein [Halomicrobium]ACV48531.1 conserved hypothetical protein [Halomicrobium mukohataei DSM 12286]